MKEIVCECVCVNTGACLISAGCCLLCSNGGCIDLNLKEKFISELGGCKRKKKKRGGGGGGGMGKGGNSADFVFYFATPTFCTNTKCHV